MSVAADNPAIAEVACDVENALQVPAVVALAGARDHFQVPLALSQRGLLSTLVTDLFWPTRSAATNACLRALVGEDRLAKRSAAGVDADDVRIAFAALAAFAGMSLVPGAQWLNVRKGKSIGALTRRIAFRSGSAALCYAGCAFEAFREGPSRPDHRVLFAMQADPRTRRALLLEEMERLPSCRDSLLREHEFSMSTNEFDELASESHDATAIVAGSRYAATTLQACGVPADCIHVVPYGVDTDVFTCRRRPPTMNGPLRVAYVGRLTQSKGLVDLLEAVRLLRTRSVVVDLYSATRAGEEVIRLYPDIDVRLTVGLSGKTLGEALHSSEILAFPSLSEGFGHVVLEGMACGLPVLATTHTCAPDVLNDGEHGFVVPTRDVGGIAARLDWGVRHRRDLVDMGVAAAHQAMQFTWDRFRRGVAKAYLNSLVRRSQPIGGVLRRMQ